MPLPIIQQPVFELTLPSTNEKIRYRPFTVKEEKILLVAKESKDIDQVFLAIKQILTNCLIDFKDNVEDLPSFDVDFILLNLRSKSVSNIVDFKIKDSDTEKEVELQMNLNDVEVKKFENHDNKIVIDENTTILMRYPSLSDIKTATKKQEKQVESMFELLKKCVDTIVVGEEVYKLKDFSKKEVDDFIDSLSSGVIMKMKEFFETMPVLRHEIEYEHEGKIKKFVVEGTETFFI